MTPDRELLRCLRRQRRLPIRSIAALRSAHHRDRTPVQDLVRATGALDERALLDALAEAHGTGIEPALTADAAAIDRIGLDLCLFLDIVPLGPAGGAMRIATSRPAEVMRHAGRLHALVGPFRLSLAPRAAVEAALVSARRGQMTAAAEAGPPYRMSCRRWRNLRPGRVFVILGSALAAGLVLAPGVLLSLLAAWTLLTLAATMALKLAATVATLRRPLRDGPRFHSSRPPATLPTFALLVPLFREQDVAGRLVRRLSALTYPKDRLDVCLVLEEDDDVTRAALARTRLPGWMRLVVVPRGGIATKPRALNHALRLARGEIVGIYDAEDAPQPDQLLCVARQFRQAPPDVACLQGMLDYYNARDSWLTRMFTLEYAAWFRLMLPGLDRLGLVVPLGGTTLFLRRSALERVGGWDAWNVTEDADLGLRLARHGLRTQVIETVTYEEATARLWPWIRQRTRWLKGYAMTWATHMAEPRRLWRDLGPWRFLGVQALFLGALSQFLLAPILWSIWLVPLGAPHPLSGLGSGPSLALTALFVGSEVLGFATAWLALRRTRHRGLAWWIPVLHLYFPLGTIAAWRGLVEFVTRPFFWDKTSHGLTRRTPDQELSSRRASVRNRVS